jgi:spore germination protein YaaH
MEDEQSMEEKLKVIQSADLAGVAEWKLGFERADVWSLISEYIETNS